MVVYTGDLVAFAKSNIASATTDGAIVAAVPGRKVRVLQVVMVGGATATTVTVNSKPAGAGTAVSADFALGANGTLVLPQSLFGWFESAPGEGITATTGIGASVGIQIAYTLV